LRQMELNVEFGTDQHEYPSGSGVSSSQDLRSASWPAT
jgi:hypothetical protein